MEFLAHVQTYPWRAIDKIMLSTFSYELLGLYGLPDKS